MLAHHLMRVRGKRRSEFVAIGESSGSANITVPSAAKAGDVAIFIDVAYQLFSTPAAVVPSGWSEFISNSSVNYRRFVWMWKVLTASDPGSTVTGMNKSDANKVILVFRFYNSKKSPSIVEAAAQLAWFNDPSPQTVHASNYGYGSVTGAFIWGSGGNPSYNSGDFDASNLDSISYINTAYKLNNITNSDNTIDCPNVELYPTALSSWLIIDQ